MGYHQREYLVCSVHGEAILTVACAGFCLACKTTTGFQRPLFQKQGNYFLASDSSPNTFVKMAISGAAVSGDNAKEHNCLKYPGIFHTWCFGCWSDALQKPYDCRGSEGLPVIKTSASVCFNFIC